MRKWNDETHLECVEALASENGWVSSEDDLSELFDEELAPHIIMAAVEAGTYRPGDEWTDTDMMNEAFNDWTDMLCRDGEIHPIQYNVYCYTGKYSDD